MIVQVLNMKIVVINNVRHANSHARLVNHNQFVLLAQIPIIDWVLPLVLALKILF